MDDLYHQEILDHYYHPDNYGSLPSADYVIEETNASCGDSFTFYLKLDDLQSTILDLRFTGTGCAISTAACSLISRNLIGKPLSTIKTLDFPYLQSLLKVEIGAARIKCLMLPAKALNRLVFKNP